MTITSTDLTANTPQFWFARAIGALRANIVMLGLVNKDYSREIATKGQTVNIAKRGALEVQDVTDGNDLTESDPTPANLTITLNKHKAVRIPISNRASSVAVDGAVQYIEDAMIALVEEAETDLLKLYATVANTVGVAGTDLTYPTLVAARKQLNDQRCPMSGRKLILSSKDDAALLNDPNFITAESRGLDARSAINEARLGRIAGFDVYMSQLVQEVAGVPTTHNLAFHKQAFGMASRALEQPDTGIGVKSEIMVDPVSGFVLRHTKAWDNTKMRVVDTLDVLYGVAGIDEDRCAVDVLS